MFSFKKRGHLNNPFPAKKKIFEVNKLLFEIKSCIMIPIVEEGWYLGEKEESTIFFIMKQLKPDFCTTQPTVYTIYMVAQKKFVNLASSNKILTIC